MIFAGCPTYDGQRYNTRSLLELQAAGCRVVEMQLSFLTRSFNELLCAARNAAASHLLMIHADVVPAQPGWVQKLVTLSALHNAGVMSVVLPIKTGSGATSTALETDDIWHPRRLTLAEVAERPETWTEPGLLVNTGLMLVDLRQLPGDVAFTFHNRIVFDSARGGYRAESIPEDWDFSRQVRLHRASVYATRAISAYHYGVAPWPNKEEK